MRERFAYFAAFTLIVFAGLGWYLEAERPIMSRLFMAILLLSLARILRNKLRMGTATELRSVVCPPPFLY